MELELWLSKAFCSDRVRLCLYYHHVGVSLLPCCRYDSTGNQRVSCMVFGGYRFLGGESTSFRKTPVPGVARRQVKLWIVCGYRRLHAMQNAAREFTACVRPACIVHDLTHEASQASSFAPPSGCTCCGRIHASTSVTPRATPFNNYYYCSYYYLLLLLQHIYSSRYCHAHCREILPPPMAARHDMAAVTLWIQSSSKQRSVARLAWYPHIGLDSLDRFDPQTPWIP